MPVTKVVDGKKVADAPAKPAAEPAPKSPKKISAKTHIRSMFAADPAAHFTMGDFMGTVYTESNIRTALSDLKNPAYCGTEGILDISAALEGFVRAYFLASAK